MAMKRYASDTLAVRLSVRIYELLLNIYPKSFQREYGPHMLQVFRDCSLRSVEREGSTGMLSLWVLTLLDLLRSTVEQYLEKETMMTKNTLIRLSGWAMAIGGAASAIGFVVLVMAEQSGGSWPSVLEPLLAAAFFIGPAGVGLGLLGLRARFGEAVGEPGRSFLLLGSIVGTALVAVGDIVQYLTNDLDDNGFGYFMFGIFAIYGALETYGILALVRKPQLRWNGLAVVAGLPISIVGVLSALMGSSSSVIDTPILVAFITMFFAMGVAISMLGYLVQLDLSDDLAAEPAGA